MAPRGDTAARAQPVVHGLQPRHAAPGDQHTDDHARPVGGQGKSLVPPVRKHLAKHISMLLAGASQVPELPLCMACSGVMLHLAVDTHTTKLAQLVDKARIA